MIIQQIWKKDEVTQTVLDITSFHSIMIGDVIKQVFQYLTAILKEIFCKKVLKYIYLPSTPNKLIPNVTFFL